MPSFRVTPSEITEEKRKLFQIEMEKAGILDLYRKALTAFREKFMDDTLPEDPMAFIREQLGVPKFDKEEIEMLKTELKKYRDELMKYDEGFKDICNQTEDDAAFNGNFMYGLYCGPSDKTSNEFSHKFEHSLEKSSSPPSEFGDINDLESGDNSKLDDKEPKFKFEQYCSTPNDKDDGSYNLGKEQLFQDSFQADVGATCDSESDSPKPATSKTKLRVPGGPMVESKREECRKTMEKQGILLVLERALAAIMMEPVFPKDPLLFLRENLRTHSPEFHEIQALIKEITIIKERVAYFKIKEEQENNDFNDVEKAEE